MTDINEIIPDCYRLAQSKGWGNPPPTFGEAMMLICCEAAEAVEAFRAHGLEDFTNYDHPVMNPNPKPEGVGSEFADILIRLGHYSALFGIDLQAEYDRKMEYNKTRPYRHGGKAL